MKKTEAARLYWFNYTARRRHEEQIKRSQMGLQRRFNHALAKASRSFTKWLVMLWHRLIYLLGIEDRWVQ